MMSYLREHKFPLKLCVGMQQVWSTSVAVWCPMCGFPSQGGTRGQMEARPKIMGGDT